MDFLHVLCTVVIFISPGNRSVVSLHGIVVKEIGDNLLVDFSKEFLEKKIDSTLQLPVIKVNENECLYE